MKDKGAAILATMLRGHALVCGPSNVRKPSNQAKGFYPLTLSAKPSAAGGVVLSVTTESPKLKFGNGGSEFDDVDLSSKWVVVSCGDDGRRYLQFQKVSDDQFDPKNAGYCESDDLKAGVVDGQITGLVYEVWDAGTSSAESVVCCLQK